MGLPPSEQEHILSYQGSFIPPLTNTKLFSEEVILYCLSLNLH